MAMIKSFKPGKRFLNLYNPLKEGIGSYDVHYINAHKRKDKHKKQINGRRAA